MITLFVDIFNAIRKYGKANLFSDKNNFSHKWVNIYAKLVNKVHITCVIFKFITEYSPIYD
jgi:hypothetical protein